jgi:hypothetical protein
MFGPEHILENVGEFLNYFMVSKVMAGADTLRASGQALRRAASGIRAEICGRRRLLPRRITPFAA